MRLVLAAAAAALLAAPALAGDVVPHPLADAGLAATFAGATVTGAYANGHTFVEAHDADGATHYVEDGVARQVGRWWVAAGLVCYDYDMPDTGGCFEIWQRLANCFDIYSAIDGVPHAHWVLRMSGTGWDARMWRTDAPSTCPADAIAGERRGMLALR